MRKSATSHDQRLLVHVLKEFFKQNKGFAEKGFKVAHLVIKNIMELSINPTILEAYLYVFSHYKISLKNLKN